jgi:hypothetical protein
MIVRPLLKHATMEMSKRFYRCGQLHRPGSPWTLDDYQAAIDWMENVYDHDKLPELYDAVVAARNALAATAEGGAA